MKTLKSIDGKSLLIGGLLVAIMFIGVAAQEAPKKAAQKYEYAWLSEIKYAMERGAKIDGQKEFDTPASLWKATKFNWAREKGWEPCPSGHKIKTGSASGASEFHQLMRRPIK